MSMRRKQLGGLISSLFFRNGRWLYKVWACAEKNTGLIDHFVIDCQKYSTNGISKHGMHLKMWILNEVVGLTIRHVVSAWSVTRWMQNKRVI